MVRSCTQLEINFAAMAYEVWKIIRPVPEMHAADFMMAFCPLTAKTCHRLVIYQKILLTVRTNVRGLCGNSDRASGFLTLQCLNQMLSV